MNKLQQNEIDLLIEFCDNYYEDEIPGSEVMLPRIKQKLENNEELEKHEIIMMKNCLDQETSDFVYKKENKKEWDLAFSILKKLIDATKE